MERKKTFWISATHKTHGDRKKRNNNKRPTIGNVRQRRFEIRRKQSEESNKWRRKKRFNVDNFIFFTKLAARIVQSVDDMLEKMQKE